MKPEKMDLESIGDVINRGFAFGPRHERIREGEREPIPSHTRSAVWWRDRGRCDICGDTPKLWELDHIVPWSAGGSDETTNLRVLCIDCNQERSNRYDPRERPKSPATWWCINCYTHSHEWTISPHDGGQPSCPRHMRSCNVMRGMRRHHDQHGTWPDWYLAVPPIDPDEEELIVAYCAHCHAPGLSARPL